MKSAHSITILVHLPLVCVNGVTDLRVGGSPHVYVRGWMMPLSLWLSLHDCVSAYCCQIVFEIGICKK